MLDAIGVENRSIDRSPRNHTGGRLLSSLGRHRASSAQLEQGELEDAPHDAHDDGDEPTAEQQAHDHEDERTDRRGQRRLAERPRIDASPRLAELGTRHTVGAPPPGSLRR